MRSRFAGQFVLLLVAAFALRLAGGFVWQSRLEGRFGFGDSQSYWILGQSIAQQQPYQYGGDRVFRSPGYPLLLSPIFCIAGEDPPAMGFRVQCALFGTLAVAAVWWLARLLFDQRAAFIAGSLAALYPGAIATSVLVLSEAPFCPLMLLHLILWALAWNAGSIKQAAGIAICAGLVAGAATLVRPSWLLFTPFALTIALAFGRTRIRHLWIGAAMLFGLTVAMTPWWVRNLAVTGHFVPTTLQVGASLYDGLNPNATGASDMEFVGPIAKAELAREPVGEDAQNTFEYRLDKRMRAESLAWARANPGRVLQLVGIKFLRTWNVWPNEPRLSAWPIRLGVMVTYVPVLCLALVGAWRTIGRGWPYILCWLPAVYFTLLHVVFVSSIRYRQPAMLSLIVLAAGVIVACCPRHAE